MRVSEELKTSKSFLEIVGGIFVVELGDDGFLAPLLSSLLKRATFFLVLFTFFISTFYSFIQRDIGFSLSYYFFFF